MPIQKKKTLKLNGVEQMTGKECPNRAVLMANNCFTVHKRKVLLIDEQDDAETIILALIDRVAKRDIRKNLIYETSVGYDIIWQPEINSYDRNNYQDIIEVCDKEEIYK